MTKKELDHKGVHDLVVDWAETPESCRSVALITIDDYDGKVSVMSSVKAYPDAPSYIARYMQDNDTFRELILECVKEYHELELKKN